MDSAQAPSHSTTAPEGVREARRRAAEAHAAGQSGSAVSELLTHDLEGLLVRQLGNALARHPVPGASLLALGGFGRRELAPFSDVDLLLLVPPEHREDSAPLAQELFTPLWDAGLEPGHALRTPEEALAHVAEDHTVATALVDARVIGGDEEAGKTLLSAFWERLRGDWLDAFVAAKVRELEERRKRHLGSVYLLEPNIKTGVGGMRDFAAGLWIARARFRLDGIGGLAHHALLSRPELSALREAHDRLLRIRCQMHLLAKRRDDRLTFSMQERVAEALHYADVDGTLAVEALMRDYYLAAQVVERATNALIERCTVERWDRRRPRRAVHIDDDFELWDGRVTSRTNLERAERPDLLVKLFVVAEQQGAPVHGAARDAAAHEADRRGATLATEPAAVKALLEYLESPGANGTALSGLAETGVLAGIATELLRLRARVQHDVYHVYTVDTHTLHAMQKLLRTRAGLLAGEEPRFTRLCQDLPRPLPLAIGLLFHDLGKGLGGDHSVKGEALVRAWCASAGLDEATTDDAAFLVREHLRLPQVAFRRDLSDPALVDGVRDLVKTRERLDMLYLLTWADISSVGPETWTEWRAQLLAELYDKVRARFDDESAPGPATFDRPEAALAGARALRAHARPHTAELERFISVLPERYLATVSAARAQAHFDLWSHAKGRPVAGTVLARPDRPGTGELVVVADDRPGLLAAVAGTLAAHSIDILAAEIFSLEDGRAFDTFLAREPGDQPPSPERVAGALADLEAVLAGRLAVDELLARRRGRGRLVAPGPSVSTKIRFDLHAARTATVVDVFTRDRVGLLADIADVFRRNDASVVLARVATEGNRAADGFYLQDMSGARITDPERLEAIRVALEEALGSGT